MSVASQGIEQVSELRRTRSHGLLRLLPLLAIFALALALRLIDLGAVRLDPFYDAAVRSMGLSWHNLLLGAFDPNASVSIDKPPLDLWLQVASVKLLGWSSLTLKLPQALAGAAAAPVLHTALRRPFGEISALTAALAIAVMPIEVITARSDTMDAVMMLAIAISLALLSRGASTGRTGWMLAAAAAMGLAFNAKLTESLVALPGLALIAWLSIPGGLRAKLPRIAAIAAVYLAVSLSWLTMTLLVPAGERPWAIGSSNGSAWNAAFLYNGIDRLAGHATGGGDIPGPSLTRLLARSGELPGTWLGWMALAALLLGAPAAVALWRRPATRAQRALGAGLTLWLLSGLALFSGMARLHPRYTEGFTVAVAAMLGVGARWLLGAGRRGPGATALRAPSSPTSTRLAAAHRPALHACAVTAAAATLAALLAISLSADVQAIEEGHSDAGAIGALHPGERSLLSRYLIAHEGTARYELASDETTKAASIIVADARPVLMLTSIEGRTLTPVATLRRLIAQGAVRYALLDTGCGPRSPPGTADCSPPARWVAAHGVDVSAQAGLRRQGMLWRLPRLGAGAHPQPPRSRTPVRLAHPKQAPAR